MRASSLFFQITVMMVSFSLLGCGGPGPAYSERDNVNASVTGSVTSAGAPVKNATISFESAANGAFGSPLDESGGFNIKLPEGTYKVTVMPASTGMTQMTAPKPGELVAQAEREDIPEPYRAASTTKAEATIVAGENKFDLALESKK